jgi:phenylpropionate dioxygenase-like ring-hydroxylating dioxygenase large terminal subunit
MVTYQGALTGTVLSDGTPLDDMFDLDNREVSFRLLNDPEVYRLEQKHLFSRAWTIVGHATEIPNRGDYVTRYIGDDPVILARGADDEITVLLNVCTHRGMYVCRAEVGNAKSFRCPYHGWTFAPDGELLAAPFEREMYDSTLAKERLGLRQARVELYAGIIFANWDPQAPGLTDYLGDFRYYLDLMFRRTDSGQEVLGGPQRFVVRANWKIPSVQSNADNYHSITLHASLTEKMAGLDRTLAEAILPPTSDGTTLSAGGLHGAIATPEGHGSLVFAQPHPQDDGLPLMERIAKAPPLGLPAALVPEVANQLSDSQLRTLASFGAFGLVGGMFPNVGYLYIGADSAMTLRMYQPRSVDTFEMWNWNLVEKDASPAFKSEAGRKMAGSFGSSGIVEQDDGEAWPSIQRSIRGYQASQQTLKYQAARNHNPPDGWEGPNHVAVGAPCRDDTHWMWWMRYRAYLNGREV